MQLSEFRTPFFLFVAGSGFKFDICAGWAWEWSNSICKPIGWILQKGIVSLFSPYVNSLLIAWTVELKKAVCLDVIITSTWLIVSWT